MTVLRAYVDDSGKEDSSPTQVLAGYAAMGDSWERFSQEWQEILKRAGVDGFHMVDAWRMARPYHDLGPIRRNQLIIDLVGCITRHVEHAFVVSIDLEPFAYWFGRTEFKHPATRPYPVAFHFILSMICDYRFRRRYDRELEVFFDVQGGESQEGILQTVENHRTIAASFGRDLVDVPTPHFIPDDGCPPLQAADLLAWLVRREDFNHRTYPSWQERAEKIWLDGALSVPCRVELLGERRLEKMSQRAAEVLEGTSGINY